MDHWGHYRPITGTLSDIIVHTPLQSTTEYRLPNLVVLAVDNGRDQNLGPGTLDQSQRVVVTNHPIKGLPRSVAVVYGIRSLLQFDMWCVIM